jgi:hypothetical protein
MSGMAQSAGTEPRDRIVAAVILIAIGGVGLASQVFKPTTDVGGWIILIIGLGLLAAFAYTRQYGYLIPAGIMTGLGAGIIVSESVTFTSDQGTGGVIVLGLGVGFLSIWVLGSVLRVARNHWWPVIPGGILATVGAALLVGGEAVGLLDYWGVVAIVIGLFVLWRAFADGRARV